MTLGGIVALRLRFGLASRTGAGLVLADIAPGDCR
jgi:hypothetical protein